MSATRTVANGAAAAVLALALSGDMHMTPPAAMAAAPPAVVQQVGTTSLIADIDTATLTDEQKAFLKEREKMATKYEMRTESTFKSAGEVPRSADAHPPSTHSPSPAPYQSALSLTIATCLA